MSLSFWSLYYSKISFWGEILYKICLVLESTAAFSFIFSYVCACAKSLQLCSTLCDPMDCNLPGSSVRGVLQARMLEWGAMPSSRGSSRPRYRTWVSSISCIAVRFFTTKPPRKPYKGFYLLNFIFVSFYLIVFFYTI